MNFNAAFGDGNENSEGGFAAFDGAEPAPEFTPLPGGLYRARILRGEACQTRAGSEAYRAKFEIMEGEHTGKTCVRTWTFGPRALPYTRRDLAALGLTTSAHLLSPFPPAGKEVRCRLVVALQRGNDGIERNDVKRIDQIQVIDLPASQFILPEDEGGF